MKLHCKKIPTKLELATHCLFILLKEQAMISLQGMAEKGLRLQLNLAKKF